MSTFFDASATSMDFTFFDLVPHTGLPDVLDPVYASHTRTFLRISPCSASHHELTGSAPVRDTIRATLVVMVHGVGPKLELTRSIRLFDRGSGIGPQRSVLMN